MLFISEVQTTEWHPNMPMVLDNFVCSGHFPNGVFYVTTIRRTVIKLNSNLLSIVTPKVKTSSSHHWSCHTTTRQISSFVWVWMVYSPTYSMHSSLSTKHINASFPFNYICAFGNNDTCLCSYLLAYPCIKQVGVFIIQPQSDNKQRVIYGGLIKHHKGYWGRVVLNGVSHLSPFYCTYVIKLCRKDD